MKRYVSFVLLLTIFVWIIQLSACSSSEKNELSTENQGFNWSLETDLIDFQTSLSDDEYESLIGADSADIMMLASPFYHSKAYEVGWSDIEHYKLRAELIDDALDESSIALKNVESLLSIIDELQSKVFQFYEVASKLDPLDSYMIYLEDDYANYMLAEGVLLVKIDSLNDFTGDEFEKSMNEYLYVQSIYEVQSIALTHLSRLSSDIEFLIRRYSKLENKEIQSELKSLYDLMDASQSIDLYIEELLAYSTYIVSLLDSLEDFDNYMALASLNISKEISKEILKNRNAIENKLDTDKDLAELILNSAEFYNLFSNDLESQLSNTMTSEEITLLEDFDENYWYDKLLPHAYADSGSFDTSKKYLEAAKSKVSLEKKKVIKKPESFFGLVKTIALNLPSITTKALGDLGATIQNKTESFVEKKYLESYGVDKKNIDDIMKKKNDDFQEKRKEGKQYGEAYNKIYSRFEDFENAAGDVSKYIIGDNLLSDSIAGVSKFFVGAVTGLGKGTVKVMNPESKTSDYIDGGIDITLSLVPGLDVFGKMGGAMVKTISPATKTFAKSSFRLVEKVVSKSKELKPLLQTGINKLSKVPGIAKATNYIKSGGQKVLGFFKGASDKITSIFKSSKNSKTLGNIKSKITKSLNDKDSIARSILADSGEETLGNYLSSNVWAGIKDYAKSKDNNTAKDLSISNLQFFAEDTAKNQLIDFIESDDQVEAKNINSSDTDTNNDKINEEIASEETSENLLDDEMPSSELENSSDEEIKDSGDEEVKDSTSVDAKVYGTYNGYLTSANVGGQNFNVGSDNTSAKIIVKADGNAIMQVDISGTGLLDMQVNLDGKISSMDAGKISIYFVDDDGDSEILNAVIDNNRMSGSVDLIVDGDNIGRLNFTSTKE